MKRALVTGGAGFIGSHLCNNLNRLGVNVLSIDNYSTGAHSNHVAGVEYINASCIDINAAAKGFKPDVVFHLGEYARVEQSVIEPFEAIENIYTTLPAVLRYACASKAKLIYSGSSTKFGDARSPYSIAKSMNTEMVQQFCCGRIPFAITYFYNVYGPGEIDSGKYSTVVSKFIRMKKAGMPVTITAPGTQRRNFTHVDDIISGLRLVAEHGNGDDYGIGAEESYSIIELAEMIGLQYTYGPSKAGNRMAAELRTDKVRNLGWRQSTKLSDYISENA